MASNTAKTAKTKLDTAGVLVVGCGYLGSRVAQIVQQKSSKIWVTTRSSQRAAALAEAGYDPIILDWTDPRTLLSLPKVHRVLVAVSYDRASRQSRYDSQVGGLKNLLSVLQPEANVCYISTTGVYHQTNGDWVDENSPARPARAGGKAHLVAEQLLHRLRPTSPATILRLAGIYGPGRVPRAADVVARRPIQSPADGYLTLIHVADAATCVMASWERKIAPVRLQRLYVVADDQPVVRREFYREIARQTCSPDPRFEPPAVDAPVAMRSAGNKRIWNRRMKHELVEKLKYPTYREGLANVLSSWRTES